MHFLYMYFLICRTNRSKSPVCGKQLKKLRGFATSTPAVKDIKRFGARLGKQSTPKKREQKASFSDEENDLCDIEVLIM